MAITWHITLHITLHLAFRAGATWLDCVPCLELPKAEIQRPGVCILGISTRCGTSHIASCNFAIGWHWMEDSYVVKSAIPLNLPFLGTPCFNAVVFWTRLNFWNRPRCEPTCKAGVAGTASAAEWQQTLSKFGLSFQFIEANRILNDMFSVTWNNMEQWQLLMGSSPIFSNMINVFG